MVLGFVLYFGFLGFEAALMAFYLKRVSGGGRCRNHWAHRSKFFEVRAPRLRFMFKIII